MELASHKEAETDILVSHSKASPQPCRNRKVEKIAPQDHLLQAEFQVWVSWPKSRKVFLNGSFIGLSSVGSPQNTERNKLFRPHPRTVKSGSDKESR